jgi:hypothetical protein
MEQQHEFVDNPTRCFSSVHSIVVRVFDLGMFAAHSSPSSIRSHGLNLALAKKFNIGHWNFLWKNSTQPFTDIARCMCVFVCVNSRSRCTILTPGDGDLLVFWWFLSSDVRRSAGVLDPFCRLNCRPMAACGQRHRETLRQIHKQRPLRFISKWFLG